MKSDFFSDENVISRHKYHKKSLEILVFLTPLLTLLFLLIGFFLVFIPSLSQNARIFVNSFHITTKIFNDYSNCRGLFSYTFYPLGIIYMLKLFTLKHLPRNKIELKSNKELIDLEIYPKNKKQEFSHWFDFLYQIILTPLWITFPFGILSYLINTETVKETIKPNGIESSVADAWQSLCCISWV